MKTRINISLALLVSLIMTFTSFAQTLDYSNYDASCEIIGGDSSIIRITVNDVSFDFIKVEGGKMDLGQLGFCQVGTFWLMETEVTNKIASLFFEQYLDLRHDYMNNKPLFPWDQLAYTEDEIMLCPFILLNNIAYGPSYYYAQKVYDEYIYVIPNALCDLISGFDFFIPSTKQWVFAARGGNKSMLYKYSGSDNIDDVGWWGGNSRVLGTDGYYHYSPHPVKRKNPNELGIYDMSGNVYEFSNNSVIVGIKEKTPATTTPEDALAKIVFGGDFNTFARDASITTLSMSSKNDGNKADVSPHHIGLRLALTPR